jgi:hypothetical protein
LLLQRSEGTFPSFAERRDAQRSIQLLARMSTQIQQGVNFGHAHALRPLRNLQNLVAGSDFALFKHAKVKAWLKRNPRFVSHFVPTSSSWMNLVERWFGHLDNKAIRRGVFLSVADLKASIEAFLTVWNQDPKPFVWTATVESIQEKLSRCRRTLEQIKPGCTSPKSRKQKKSTV